MSRIRKYVTYSSIAASAVLLSSCGGGGGSASQTPTGTSQNFGSVTATAVGPYQPPLIIGSRNAVFTGVYGASFNGVVVRYPRAESIGFDAALRQTNVFLNQNGNVANCNYGTGQISYLPTAPIFGNTSTPSVSGLGTRIAYIRVENGQPRLHVANFDGTQDVALVRGGWCESPAFSPDGSTIVFTVFANGLRQIFKVPANGGTLVPLTSATDNCLYPAWSPDGSKIAFFRQVGGTGPKVLTEMSPTGTILGPVPNTFTFDYPSGVCYVPGTSIILSTGQSGTSYLLMVSNPDAGYSRIGTSDYIGKVTAAPVGGRYALYSRGGASPGVYLLDLKTGANSIFISNSGANAPFTDPSWGPYLTARAVVGSGAPIASVVGGFLFGQTGDGMVTSFVGVDAVTRSSITMIKQTDANPSQSVVVCTVSADSIKSLSYMNDLRGGVTTVASSTNPVRGAVIAFSADSGQVISVVPFTQSAAVQKTAALRFKGDFTGVYGRTGAFHPAAAAHELTIDPVTGSAQLR